MQALAAYLEGLRVDRLDPWIWAAMGETLYERGALAEAVEPLKNAATPAPGRARVDIGLAAAALIADRASGLAEFLDRRDDPPGSIARVARFLCVAAGEGVRERLMVDSADTDAAAGTILRRIADAGRADVLDRLRRSLGDLSPA